METNNVQRFGTVIRARRRERDLTRSVATFGSIALYSFQTQPRSRRAPVSPRTSLVPSSADVVRASRKSFSKRVPWARPVAPNNSTAFPATFSATCEQKILAASARGSCGRTPYSALSADLC